MTTSSGSSTGETAERFLDDLQERLDRFGLELHPEKTRLLEFGRYAEANRRTRRQGRPRRSTFWASRTIAEKTGEDVLDWGASRQRTGCAEV